MNNYISTASLYYPDDPYLAHHGIKGQKWGVRRYQNEDGSLTPAGLKRYGSVENFNAAREKTGRKLLARATYSSKKMELLRKSGEIDAKYDRAKDKNMFGLKSGGIATRAKNHVENEYKREQEQNKVRQEFLDAKRQYRIDKGKKKVDTLLMRLTQKDIDAVSSKTLDDFTREYVKKQIEAAADVALDLAVNHDKYKKYVQDRWNDL